METEGRKLVGRDVVADVAGLRSLRQQVSDHVAELLLRSGDLFVPMQGCGEFGVAVTVGLMGDEGIGPQYSFEPLASVSRLVSDFSEQFEVACDLTFWPGGQNRFDIREEFVHRGASDAG